MMNCHEATKKMTLLEEGELSFVDRIKLRFHMWMCSYCDRFYKQWKYLAKNFAHDSKVVADHTQKEKWKRAIESLK